MADIKAGVELSLRDKFSSKIKGAAGAAAQFGEKAVSAARMADRAFSGAGAQIASLGVTLGGAALAKASIDYEDAMIRIGTNAGMSGKQVNELRRHLLRVAADAAVPNAEMVSFAKTLADNSIGFDAISESAPLAAAAIQGLGISGSETAALFSVLYNRGADLDTITQKFNNLAEIDDRLSGMGLTQFTQFLPGLLETSEASVENIEDLYIAINTLGQGSNGTKAIQQYTAAMQDFASTETRDAINRNLRFNTKESSGELKSFGEIMDALAAKAKEVGSADALQKGLHLSDSTIKALKQYMNYYDETIKKVSDLGDTSDAIAKRAEQNAGSAKSAIVRLNNAVTNIADEKLAKPIENIAKFLNEHPDGMETAIKGVGAALIGLGAIKTLASVTTMLSNFKNLRGGGKSGVGAGIPVHVTNMGGLGGGGAGIDLSNKSSNAKNFAAGAKGAAVLGTGYTLVNETVGAYQKIKSINADETLSEQERKTAKGGAVGKAVGTTIGYGAGAAAGAFAVGKIGAMIGTAIAPGIGTVVGGAIGAAGGALVGYLGGKAGQAIGEKIGGSITKEVTSAGIDRELNSVERIPEQAESVKLDGQVNLGVDVHVTDDKTTVSTRWGEKDKPSWLNTGAAFAARGIE
jgi:hypothetical protein